MDDINVCAIRLIGDVLVAIFSLRELSMPNRPVNLNITEQLSFVLRPAGACIAVAQYHLSVSGLICAVSSAIKKRSTPPFTNVKCNISQRILHSRVSVYRCRCFFAPARALHVAGCFC